MHSHSARGQVSLEALLIWAALAGSLGLLLPFFGSAMDAYALRGETFVFAQFTETLQDSISDLSFASPGAIHILHVPHFPGFDFEVNSDSIILTLTHSHFSSPREEIIQSQIPLSGLPLSDADEWILERTPEGITIQ